MQDIGRAGEQSIKKAASEKFSGSAGIHVVIKQFLGEQQSDFGPEITKLCAFSLSNNCM